MIITAKLAERVQRGFRQVFCACATPGSPARRRLLRATSASWFGASLFYLALFYPLPYLTSLACTLLFCAMFFQTLLFRMTRFSHKAFHTNIKETFQ